MPDCIYLDHAATTFPDEAVIASMAECMREAPYNASAAYDAAGKARRIYRQCRMQLSRMLSCEQGDIFFTSGGTEANNQVLYSFSGKHVVLSAIEHSSVLEAAKAARCDVTLVFPDASGYISPESVKKALRPETKLICLMAANNETGVIQPVEDVFQIASARRIHLHVDAVQAFGHIPVSAGFCDSMSFCAHKLYGPGGVGALYVRSGATVSPLIHGGGQQRGMRAGTQNTPALCGFYTAAKMADADMLPRMERERELLGSFASRMERSGLVLLGKERPRLPGVLALRLPGVSAEQMIAALDLRGILISGGAACASHSGRPSHVYTAMGMSDQEAAQVIRVSIGRHTTADALDTAARAIEEIILQSAHQNTSR